MCRALLLDTSVLLFIGERRLDLLDVAFSAETPVCRVIIARAVLEELERLALRKSSRRGRNAYAVLSMINSLMSKHGDIVSIVELETKEGDTDSALISLAKKEGFILATADRRLKKRAEESGVEVLFLRESKGRLI
ncbi:hypothetical protein IG193_03955 [Infirmifilum lucidum]|uniref:PIN domain-containing protein n=1 Tax=Infirmifilum lucidum TaxID=2776706 RepID=A0A7L9FIF6_9CREN|nr:PIN domain-containing protein [Infirmifilum lucidum]QOJ79618.1 hypothetical protein IG193_03955 [Infirmifilum lucidum]